MGEVVQTAGLTGRDLDVAKALVEAVNKIGGPVSPRHCGGSAGSDHSARLNWLVRQGFAEVLPKNPSGGGKVYRPTDALRATLSEVA
jgi:hypothetical protein